MAKKISKDKKCAICNKPLAIGEVIYQHYENVVNYIPSPRDKLIRNNEIIRICPGCAKKHSIKNLYSQNRT